MSASEKLKALEKGTRAKTSLNYGRVRALNDLEAALPQIVAVVEAAEVTWCVTGYRDDVICPRGGIGCPLPHPEDAALAALEEALS